MRTEGQVKHQLKQVLFRHLQKALRRNFKRRPHTCIHNKQVPAEPGFTIGLCGHAQRKGLSCDARIGVEQAKNCPLWTPLLSKAGLRDQFEKLLRSDDRGRIAAEYPDVVALLWVLDTGEAGEALETAMSDFEDSPVEDNPAEDNDE